MTADALPVLAHGLGKRFGRKVALQAFDFELRRGTASALVGRNGADPPAVPERGPRNHLMWIELESGRTMDEREVPDVIAVSADLTRIACLEWTRDDIGWAPALVIVGRDGSTREILPRSALGEGPDPTGDQTDGLPAGGQASSAFHRWPARRAKDWIAFDDDLTRATWLRVALRGREASCEVVVTDVGTGESRILVPADALPITLARGAVYGVELKGLTADGAAARLHVGGEAWLVDLEDGLRSVIGPSRPHRHVSPSGRRIAWYDGNDVRRGPEYLTTGTPSGLRRIAATPARTAMWVDDERLLIATEGRGLQLVHHGPRVPGRNLRLLDDDVRTDGRSRRECSRRDHLVERHHQGDHLHGPVERLLPDALRSTRRAATQASVPIRR